MNECVESGRIEALFRYSFSSKVCYINDSFSAFVKEWFKLI